MSRRYDERVRRLLPAIAAFALVVVGVGGGLLLLTARDHGGIEQVPPTSHAATIGPAGLPAGNIVVEYATPADRDAIDQLASWAGIPDLRERIVVRRTVGPGDFAADLHAWSGGALGPAHTWRQSALLRGRNASRHIDGLLYAGGSTIPGIGLPMCLISAEVMVKRLASDRSTEPLAAPL